MYYRWLLWGSKVIAASAAYSIAMKVCTDSFGLNQIYSGESASEGSSEEGSDANSQNVSTV